MAKIQEQIANARKANISDQEIFQAIMKSPKYGAGFEQARAAGLSNADIAKDLGLQIRVNAKTQPIRLTAESLALRLELDHVDLFGILMFQLMEFAPYSLLFFAQLNFYQHHQPRF